MKIGITQIILGNISVNDTIELCKNAGYEAVELTLRDGTDCHPELSEDEFKTIAKKFSTANIEISSLAGLKGNLLSLDDNERQSAKESLVSNIEIAGIMEVGAILVHPGQLAVEGTYQQVWNNLVVALKDLVYLAKSKNVAISLENVWNKFLLSPKEMREIIDEISSPWVGAYLDTANMMAYGYPEHWIRELGSRIKRVHFKDFNRREHRFVNLLDGDTNWSIVMEELRRIGYQDSVIHEVDGDIPTQIDIAKRMRQIVEM